MTGMILLTALLLASASARAEPRALEELRALAPSAVADAPALPRFSAAAEPETDDRPLCPARGLVLPETAKAEIVSVSDAGGYEFMRDFARETLRAQPDSPPVFLLNAHPENIERLRRDLSASGGRVPRLISLQATELDEEGHKDDLYLEWQQDFFKPQFDPKTGKPVAALVPGYPAGNLGEALSKALAKLGVATRRLPEREGRDPFSGGNVDMLPGGICLMGDGDVEAADLRSYAAQMCGPDSTLVKAPTSWLYSTHVDELVRVVPDFTQAGCAYAVLTASPDKALEVMRQHREEPAFSKPGGLSDNFFYDITRSGMASMCGTYQSIHSGYSPLGSKDYEARREKEIFSDSQILRPTMTDAQLNAIPGPEYCPAMKNGDAVQAFEVNGGMKEYSALVQGELTRFSGELMSALRGASPQCRFDLVPVPVLFVGSIEVDRDGSHRPAPRRERSGFSVYPDPINSVLVGRTLLLPEPYNGAFAEELRKTLAARGIEARFLDSLKAHELSGNVHCSVQVLRSCRPR
jgi:hypothetical protein